MQTRNQEQLAKFQPFLKTSIFWTLEATLRIVLSYIDIGLVILPL